jgi:hypothetical protein
MHDNVPGGFWFGLRATIFCLVAASRFDELAKSHDTKVNERAKVSSSDIYRSAEVRRAFSTSCLLTTVAVVTGYLSGAFLHCRIGVASTNSSAALQAASASVLLIATLAVVGWKIQSYGGESLVEKVNQWLTRSLFVVGTFCFSVYLGWS